ncbi:MAG: putative bifunctional diguanylate cyclase/phosphodiesterase, partial [Xanthobacteraceae bacterium]
MPPSAQERIADETKQSRWNHARVGLVVPIGVIVAVAVVCVVVAVLTSAQRADDVSLYHQQQLVQRAIADHGEQMLRQLDSVAGTPAAAANIRANYNPLWVRHRVCTWLQKYFGDDVVAVVDGSDQIEFFHAGGGTDAASATVRADLAPSLDLLRGRLAAFPSGSVDMLAGDNPLHPGRQSTLVQSFLGRPAIIAAVAVGDASELKTGNSGAPIVFAIKFIDAAMLREIGNALQLTNLRRIGIGAPAGGDYVAELSDPHGNPVARFGWKPNAPGWQVVISALPFIAVALAGFALLVGLIMGYMRRTAKAIAAGETRLRHLALHDPVCGLPNRIFFGERLEAVIQEVRGGSATAAVFYIDLDHFKDVNDTLGHHIGDALILNVTQRLSRILRGDDLVARLGGDEFAIITTCASDSYSLLAIAGRIISTVCAPYAINGHNIIIGASIGIAVMDRRARDAADILRYADMALYRAKNEGRNRACIYDAAMDADLSNRKLLEGDLLQAIRGDGLRAAYQPIVNASGDSVIAVEALARWTHPTIGEIPPSEFIPIAEHSGLIVELGEWMLRRACLDGHDWPGVTVAVNVSPLQFRRSDFVEVVERILKETAFDASRLELELTESTLLGNFETAELSMLRLKAIGVRFALDDFGTGYSSLSYLHTFPLDKIKIDRSFTMAIGSDHRASIVIASVAGRCKMLGMDVLVEWIET